MANHKSSVKRAKQSLVRNARNLSTKRAVRTAENKLRTAMVNKEVDKLQELLKAFISKIGKATATGVFHTKTSSRKISRLAESIHTLSKTK